MKNQSEQQHNDSRQQDIYETGSTRPPKNHGGIIAVLLVLVIVLCGVTTFLGAMNIRLFHMMTSMQEEQTREDAQLVEQADPTDTGDGISETTAETASKEVRVRLGLKCVTVSDFDRRYYLLPDGCLVMDVIKGGPAELGGIHIGDVIVSINGQTVESAEELLELLQGRNTGEEVNLEVYRTRTKNKVTIRVTLE